MIFCVSSNNLSLVKKSLEFHLNLNSIDGIKRERLSSLIKKRDKKKKNWFLFPNLS